MKSGVYAILMMLAIAGAYLAGSWSARPINPTASPVATRTVLYYVDPMHPAYRSDKPGIAPDCGMELVPVYADGSRGGSAEVTLGSPPGTVSVGPERQQLIGVRVAAAGIAPGFHTLRVLGRVVPDETRIYRVNSATDGWVKKILPATTDSMVEKDQLLATFYAPEFFSAMKAYLYGLRSLDRFEASGKESREQLDLTGATIEGYRNSLRNLGMTEHQLDEIMRTRQAADNIDIRAPSMGLILARNISAGQRFEKGTELYRIADLAKVWIVAETFEAEAAAFKPGMQIGVAAPYVNKTFSARVVNVPPRFDPATRTLKVRLEADNPGYLLRPDMFVDIELPVTRPSAIVVPVDAVVDSGIKQIVYVARRDGLFEPRRVETGWRAGDKIEILKGLTAGEKIVVAGTFLIDSESRMKAAAAGIYGETSEDPVCGMEVDITKARAAGLTSEFRGQTYYFCAAEDKTKFDAQPARYALKHNPGPTTTAGKRLEQVEWKAEKTREPKGHEHQRPSVESATTPGIQ